MSVKKKRLYLYFIVDFIQFAASCFSGRALIVRGFCNETRRCVKTGGFEKLLFASGTKMIVQSSEFDLFLKTCSNELIQHDHMMIKTKKISRINIRKNWWIQENKSSSCLKRKTDQSKYNRSIPSILQTRTFSLLRKRQRQRQKILIRLF